MLNFVFNNSTKDPKPGSDFFNKLIIGALKELKLERKNIELSVNLVGVDRMRKLNKKYRGKDTVTDVLSFKSEVVGIGRKNKKGLFVMPKDNMIKLGDIVICPRIAREKSENEGRSFRKEMALLTIHGLLHLLGYDHEKSSEEGKIMFRLQDKIISRFRIK